MSQIFVEDFDPAGEVHDTMESVFDNTKTLKSSFSGDNEPGFPVIGMLWADTTNTGSEVLNIRGSSDWVPLMNLGSGEVTIQNQQIESGHISNAARKGSLVEGQNIVPNSCTLRVKEVPPVSLPIVRSGGVNYIILTSEYSQVTREVHRIYVDPNASFLEMHAVLTRGICKFGLSTSPSPQLVSYPSSEQSVSGVETWTTNPCLLAVSSISGWYYLKIQARAQSSTQNGALLGFSFRFGI